MSKNNRKTVSEENPSQAEVAETTPAAEIGSAEAAQPASQSAPEGENEGSEPEADTESSEAERCFEVIYDTVGAGPSFQKGEVVTAGDVEFLGIERLLEIGAIREL